MAKPRGKMSERPELEARREELMVRYREILAEEPPDGCKLKVFLTWLGRRSEVELDVRKIDAELVRAFHDKDGLRNV